MSDDMKFLLGLGGFLVMLLGFCWVATHQTHQKDAREDQLVAEMVKAGVPVSEAILAVREVK